MLVIGIDAHKRSHTAVAVDAVGRQVASAPCTRRPQIISVCFGGLSSSTASVGGRWRTVAMCLGVWNGICWPRGNGSCGCRPS